MLARAFVSDQASSSAHGPAYTATTTTTATTTAIATATATAAVTGTDTGTAAIDATNATANTSTSTSASASATDPQLPVLPSIPSQLFVPKRSRTVMQAPTNELPHAHTKQRTQQTKPNN